MARAARVQSWRRLRQPARAEALLARAAHPAAHGPAPLPVAFGTDVLGGAYADAPNMAQTAVPYIRALLRDGRSISDIRDKLMFGESNIGDTGHEGHNKAAAMKDSVKPLNERVAATVESFQSAR